MEKNKETETLITTLFKEKGLGSVSLPISHVSGGFMHRMYRVSADGKEYAVKHLNPAIMKRPGVLNNYMLADRLESIIEKAGISIVAALTIDGCKMQGIGGEYFYIFPWQEGSITDWNNITCEQCAMAGAIQGKIHSIEQRTAEGAPELSDIDWDDYINKATAVGSEIAKALTENRDLLYYVQDELNKARLSLPDIECITDEDMDPKNVMWHDGKPFVIDLECLSYGNPVSSALQLSLQWAGITLCDIDTEKIKAFFGGYHAAYDNGFRDYDKVFGLAYTWIEWLEYNITRALGNCQDENERRMGMEEVRNTLARIRYIQDKEDIIQNVLKMV